MQPLDDDAVAALPTLPSMGTDAVIFEGVGSYKGMQDASARADQRMLAAIVQIPGAGGTIATLKAIGRASKSMRHAVTSRRFSPPSESGGADHHGEETDHASWLDARDARVLLARRRAPHEPVPAHLAGDARAG